MRGVTYKGGAFTPGAEQKAAPREQPGSPERFRKTLRLRYNRQKALAEAGAQHYDPMLDAANTQPAGSAHNIVHSSHSPRNLGGSFSPDVDGRGSAVAPVSSPVESFNTTPENAWKTMSRSNEATPGGLVSAARHVSRDAIRHEPIALPSDIDAMRHLVAATVGQGITPRQRYAEFLRADGMKDHALHGHIDELHKLLGTAVAGSPALMSVLTREVDPPINHDAALAPGVERLHGTIVPHLSVRIHGFLPAMKASQVQHGNYGRDVVGMRYLPNAAPQAGLIDSLQPHGNGVYYGTPDGRMFLDPSKANEHVMANPQVRALVGKVHAPWMPIDHRIDSYTGADHVLDALLRHPELGKLETDIRDPAARFINGGAVKKALSLYREAFAREPERARKLLDLLSEHFGTHAPYSRFGVSGMVKKNGSLVGSVANRDAALGAQSGLAATTGAKKRSELVDMTTKLFGLFNRNVYGSSIPLHIGVGTGADRGAVGSTNTLPYDAANRTLWQDRDMLAGKDVHPAALLGFAQMATPSTLAHEVMHAVESNVPGISRASREHAMARQSSRAMKQGPSFDSNNRGVMPTTDMPWVTDPWERNYAHKLSTPHFVGKPVGFMGDKRDLHVGDSTSEYLPTMFEEFFARPVRMAREHPQVARFLFGLMNGALRSHQ